MTLFDRIADLPFGIESYSLESHELIYSGQFTRLSTVICLAGAGQVGRGEDTSYSKRDQERLRSVGPVLDLVGNHTLRSFSSHLESLELWPEEPEHPMYFDYRRWAYESAALELALAQTGVSLAELLGREQRRPLFVVSTALGAPPSTARLRELLEFDSRLRFKLDTSNDWDEAFIAELRELDRVDVIDFKGAYSGTTVDQKADPALYARVIAGLPDAHLEDPHSEPEICELLADSWDRVCWDAPIHSAADVREIDPAPKLLNIKPSRCGTLRKYLELIDYCEAEGISMYGGGQFELADGRRTIQMLAGLFHPDGPNDIAPVQFNRVKLERPVDDEELTYPDARATSRAGRSSRTSPPSGRSSG